MHRKTARVRAGIRKVRNKRRLRAGKVLLVCINERCTDAAPH